MRPIWSGAISFGLVNIPVKLYSASEERALKFRMLEKKSLSPIGYKKVIKDTNREVEQKDIVKGYECGKGQYVILEPADFKRASPRKTELIDISRFTDEDEIDGKLLEKPYFVEPAKKAEKAYALLRDALQKSGKVGIATFVFHDKEHVGILKSEDAMLYLIQLRYADELRKPEDLNLPRKADYSKKELDLALSLIEQLTEKDFDITEYHDTYAEELRKVIRAKAKGQLKEIPGTAKAPQPTQVTDILAMLKQSLAESEATR
jgi:DNA end-binding protein Ku